MNTLRPIVPVGGGPFAKTRMTYIKVWILITTLTLSGVKCSLAQLKMEQMDRYTFALSGLTIPKQLKDLKFIKSEEFAPNGSGVAVIYGLPEKGFELRMLVYESPVGTTGPMLVLDANGKEVLEDREEEIKKHNAVLKLTAPSASYFEEYANIIKGIGSPMKMTNEFRFKAVPARKDSPIAFGALFAGTVGLKDGSKVPWTSKTYLYSIPGYFVNIQCSYPSQLWMEFPDVEFIQAINWDKIAPSKSL